MVVNLFRFSVQMPILLVKTFKLDHHRVVQKNNFLKIKCAFSDLIFKWS